MLQGKTSSQQGLISSSGLLSSKIKGKGGNLGRKPGILWFFLLGMKHSLAAIP